MSAENEQGPLDFATNHLETAAEEIGAAEAWLWELHCDGIADACRVAKEIVERAIQDIKLEER